MKPLVLFERLCLMGHIATMPFGWLGLLWILPNPDILASLPPMGIELFRVSMQGGGVVNILLGTAAVAIYAYRTLGLKQWLAYMIPAVSISLSSELIGTSTGFPFGHYGYLSGLGYKIAGRVPFTIPLSWFYVGFVSYLLALGGLKAIKLPNWARHGGAIALGAMLLTCWDFVLDPAMSQTTVQFWAWEQPGAFFGMPYQNFAGWFGTGVIFTGVAALLWGQTPEELKKVRLNFPLIVYLSNFTYAAVLSGVSGFTIPVLLGLVVGVIPAVTLWWMNQSQVDVELATQQNLQRLEGELAREVVQVAAK